MQHLDDGMIHTWLDGQLPPDEAAAVEAHVAECRQCADAVAEARGLIAASSRILTALDSVPRDVAPKPIVASESALPEGVLSLRRDVTPNVETTPAKIPGTVRASRAPRRWFTAPTLAAAAAVVVAVGVFSFNRREAVSPTADLSSRPNRVAADSAVAARPTAIAAAPSSQSTGSGAAANEARRETAPPASPQATQEADRSSLATKRMAFADSAGRPPDTSTVTIIRGNAISSERLQPQVAKAGAGRGDTGAAAGSIRGRVTDANNTAIVGAMVRIAGTNTGVTTNPQGEYSLGGVQAGGQQLLVDRAGYQPANRTVSVVQGQTVSADVVLSPAPTALTSADAGAAARERAPARVAQAPPPAPTPSQPPATLQGQSTAAGCYEWTVTPTSAQQRTRFLQIPRRLALDTVVTPSSNDGIWYRARDLARTATLPEGLWRPIDSGVEVQWVIGAKSSTVRLTGSPTGVMRGTIEEIDRAAGTGESGNVLSMRRPCEG